MPADLAEPPPNVEIWDETFLTKAKRQGGAESRSASYDDVELSNSKFRELILHPAPTKPVAFDKMKAPDLPVYLTKKERKRIRRQTRKEREKEMQDKIALGLMAPPEPKLKLANFMKVGGSEPGALTGPRSPCLEKRGND